MGNELAAKHLMINGAWHPDTGNTFSQKIIEGTYDNYFSINKFGRNMN